MQPIPDLTRRTRRYWMIDGLAELMIGSIFLLTGVAQLAPLVVRLLSPAGPICFCR
ncbi:MAG: hypothetical protein NZQ09_06370 [Chloroflexus sp.]|nr:hypothetical protein [Chloroflexus sp.]